jgi:hypothetical protein
MAIPGGVIAAAAGIVGGLGYLWAKQRAAATAAPSTCESLCIAAAKLAGVTGDAAALCKTTCGIEGAIKGAVEATKRAAVQVGTAVGGIVGGGSGPKFCSTCCPEGSEPKFTSRPDGSTTVAEGAGDQAHILDQRSPGNVMGAVCVDKLTGAILGTLTDKFNPYTVNYTAPAVVPVKSPVSLSPLGDRRVASTVTQQTDSSRAAGGVTVTQTVLTPEQEACRALKAAMPNFTFLSCP